MSAASGFRTALVALALAATVATGTAQAHPGHQEDEPGWDCTVDGNRICGPTRAVASQCQSDVAPWPVVNPNGLSAGFR